MKSDLTNQFFQLVHYAIHACNQAPQIDADEWEEMYDMARKQSIIGVVFEAVQRMGKDATIPRQLKMKWFFRVNKIKNRNMLLNQRSAELVAMFQEEGFDCCVLKGQGNALMYPDPFSRMSGDIDLFVMPRGAKMNINERRDLIMDYVRKKYPNMGIRYQLISYHVFPDAEVGIHFIPTFMNNPLYNHRILKWMDCKMAEQCQNMAELPDHAGRIAVPTIAFNIVFQLAHMMRHFFDEGIGLRQFMDYYYLLRTSKDKIGMRNEDLEKLFRYLGLWKFARATMYVMQEVFVLDEVYMIAPVDVRLGKTLLSEILKGGNFGHSSGLWQYSSSKKYFLKIWRNMHFIREYPAEALCEPIFRTWHYFWRLRHS